MSESKTYSPGRTIALVGANGTLGSLLFSELLVSSHGFHIRTLSRKKQSPLGERSKDTPNTDHVQVDFASKHSLVEALKGCDFFVNAMGTEGDYGDAKKNLVLAAKEAGRIKGYIPSDFGIDWRVPIKAFDHPVWLEKRQHIEFAENSGLRTISIFDGLFMEHPFGGLGPYHGFNYSTKEFIICGNGKTPLTLTSKYDIAKAVARVCDIILSTPKSSPDPLHNKSEIRISSHNLTPYQIVKILGDGWKVVPLVTDREQIEFESNLGFSVMGKEEEDRLGPQFDEEFASDISRRLWRGIGEGGLDFEVNDNEVINPGERYWKWRKLEGWGDLRI